MTRCAFDRLVINGLWEVDRNVFDGFGTDLEARLLYLEDAGRPFLLVAVDCCYLWRSTCTAIRRHIQQVCGIPFERIWIHLTQDHTAPTADQMDGEPARKLAERLVPAVKRMAAEAQEAELRYAVVDTENRYNFNREVYVPELGAVTAWGGRLQTDRPGSPYAATPDPDTLLLEGYAPDLPAWKAPITFDRPADPLAAMLVFRRKADGETLGTLVRFSGHPDAASNGANFEDRTEKRRYHYDWPGYTRQRVEDALGGGSLVVVGPCGNVGMRYTAGRTYQDADRAARQLGEAVADCCLDAWRSEAADWEPVRLGEVRSGRADLPIRESFPASREECLDGERIRQRLDALKQEMQDARARGERPTRIKQLADEIQYTWCLPRFVAKWGNLSDEEIRRRAATVELAALRLNDLVLAGLPGESMTETSMLLQARTLGRKLLTFDMINGYLMYIMNDDAWRQGGYSYWCSVLARGAEPAMRRKAQALINETIGRGD